MVLLHYFFVILYKGITYMLRPIFIIAIILMSLSYEVYAQDHWKQFTPDKQSFSVLSPSEMRAGEKKLLTDVGEMHPVTWMSEGGEDDPNYLYMVSYVDYPQGTFHKDSLDLIDDFLNESVDALIENLNGELIYSAPSDYGHYPGIIIRASYNENTLVLRARMLLVDDRFYALQVYTTKEKSLNDDAARFLNSFRIK